MDECPTRLCNTRKHSYNTAILTIQLSPTCESCWFKGPICLLQKFELLAPKVEISDCIFLLKLCLLQSVWRKGATEWGEREAWTVYKGMSHDTALVRWTVVRSWSSTGRSFIETECFETSLNFFHPTPPSVTDTFNWHTRSPTQTRPGSIYNSWRDLVAPLREERGEFTPWPNYTLLPFAPSALRSSRKAECTTSAHSEVLSAFRADGLFLKKQLSWFSLSHTYTLTPKHNNTHFGWVNLHTSLTQWDFREWRKNCGGTADSPLWELEF